MSVLLVFVIPVGIILPVVMIVIDVLMFRNLNVEYEYVFVNGDLDIDKIMNKARRKRMFSVDADQMELLAPVGAVELMQYKKIKSTDTTVNAISPTFLSVSFESACFFISCSV